MASDSPLSPAVAGCHIDFGITGKTSPGGDIAGGGDEICKKEQTPPPFAVGGECLLDPSVPVAATKDGDVKITVTTAVAGDGPNVGSGCGLFVGVGAGVSSDGSNGQSSTHSAVIESDYGGLHLQPQDTNLAAMSSETTPVPESVDLEEGRCYDIAYPNRFGSRLIGGLPVPQPDNVEGGLIRHVLPGIRHVLPGIRHVLPGIRLASRISMGGNPVLQPVDVEEGCILAGIGFASPISMGGIPVPQPGNVEGGPIRRVLTGIGFAFPIIMVGTPVLQPFPISMGGISMLHPGNEERGLIRRALAGIGLASPISTGDILVIQSGNVEGGHLLAGGRFGVGRSDIAPTNDDFRMFITNAEPQTGNDPPPLEISGDNSHLVPPLERHFRSNCFVILFVTSEILGIVFEIIYQESHIMGYFFFWTVCITIAMCAARLLAMIEGGMANREQFAVYLRGFSFLLLELLQYWGISQGNYVTALKIILRVSGAVISWWVVGVLKTYMDAFGMHLPLRRRDD